ncbi:TPA_asm: DUF551 domain-containing protein [Salmonella enterica subsp. diarizonae]|nr:DUF551 domain-containing protein [Salmonella enterica subsp. diarizonae]EIF8605892.1 DUF551 domain-containing protein [Salmonella enterica]ELI2365595.1 DUF551 domain-containing protein [Salmonella enterica]HAB1613617.1 DUF551 domain-containing protein [Salmonella enterica subsp. diarizonae]
MTTITKEWLQQTIAEFENTRDDIPFGLSDDDAKVLIVLKRALASLDAEPVRYLNKFSGTCVTLEQQPNAADDVAVYIPLHAAPPVQETCVYNDVLNIIGLLENNEWAEHCTSTVLGSLLESEITRLVGKEQPTPVVPESISVRQAISALESADSVTTIGQAYKMGWNACRAAMLQGVEPVSNHDELALYYLQGQKDGLEWAAQLAEANHPLTGDWLYDDPLELAKAIRKGPDMPGFAGSSPVTPDGWISCSERMPEDEQEVIVHNKLGYRYVSYFDEHSGLFFDMRGSNQMNCIEHILVTHWMPLPAAPEPEQS